MQVPEKPSKKDRLPDTRSRKKRVPGIGGKKERASGFVGKKRGQVDLWKKSSRVCPRGTNELQFMLEAKNRVVNVQQGRKDKC